MPYQHDQGRNSLFYAQVGAAHLALRFPEGLHQLGLIAPSPENAMRHAFDELYEQHRLSVNIVAEVDDMAMMRLPTRAAQLVRQHPVGSRSITLRYAIAKVSAGHYPQTGQHDGKAQRLQRRNPFFQPHNTDQST